jgi:hypothetical protein
LFVNAHHNKYHGIIFANIYLAHHFTKLFKLDIEEPSSVLAISIAHLPITLVVGSNQGILCQFKSVQANK